MGIQVESFETESNFDYLDVNGMEYDGTTGPNGVTPTADIFWYSDESVVRSGWRLCAEAPAPTSTLTTTVATITSVTEFRSTTDSVRGKQIRSSVFYGGASSKTTSSEFWEMGSSKISSL